MVKLTRINIEKPGLHKFFSPNEVRIMELLWERGGLPSPLIKECMNDLSLACVSGTLDRLNKADFVRREIDQTDGKIKYIYYPNKTKDEIGQIISKRVYDSLFDTFGHVVTDTFGQLQKDSGEELEDE